MIKIPFGILQQQLNMGSKDIEFITSIEFNYSSSVTAPTGMLPGDLLIVMRGADANSFSDAEDEPNGFTRLCYGRSACTISCSYRVQPNPVDSQITGIDGGADSSDNAYIAMVFRNVNITNPIDVTTPDVNYEDGRPLPPSITTVTDGCMLLVGGAWDDQNIESSVGSPSGYTDIREEDLNDTATDLVTIACGYKLQETAGTETPGTFSGGLSSGEGSSSFIVALRPL